MSQAALTGGCLCGHVQYSSTLLPEELNNCHCHMCRKLSGAPFTTFARFPTDAITWVSGEDSVKKKQYSAIAERGHCPECGSQIFMQYKCEKDQIHLTAGSINEESVKGVLPKASAHIFMGDGEKASWYDLPSDGLRRQATFSTAFQKKIDDWKEVFRGPGLG